MNYEYTLSEIPDKQPMSPNKILYNAPLPVVQWLIEIKAAIACGFEILTLAGQGFKVMATIGSWNFPSHYFCEMVSTQHRRAKFITTAKAFLMQYNITGIDIDWEFPRSAPRDNAVKITNDMFRHVQDDGGQCA